MDQRPDTLIEQRLGLIKEFEQQASILPASFDAVLLIDVQKEFCDKNGIRGNDNTEYMSAHIAQRIPEFRSEGVTIYAIGVDNEYIPPDQKEFHNYVPAQGDVKISKPFTSAFHEDADDLETILKDANHQNLLVMGFNTNSCVKLTAMDAQRRGFNTWLVVDCTGNDTVSGEGNTKHHVSKMLESGTNLVSSEQALVHIRQSTSCSSLTAD
ncbi:MAG: cysteine hydrolase family protein [Alphaproteobacteria bacterium]